MTRDPELHPGPAPGISRALGRGLAKRCPKCGLERPVEGFYRIRPACSTCGCRFQRDVGDHIGVIYITTAIQTALFAAFVLLFEPAQPWIARTVMVFVALSLMLLNLPNRKGLAIAIDYLTERDRE